MISQKYLLPEMENSFPISQMMVVFKAPPICHVWKVKHWKQTGWFCWSRGLWEAKETLGGIGAELWRWCCWQKSFHKALRRDPWFALRVDVASQQLEERRAWSQPPRRLPLCLRINSSPSDSWTSLASDTKFPSISITLSESIEWDHQEFCGCFLCLCRYLCAGACAHVCTYMLVEASGQLQSCSSCTNYFFSLSLGYRVSHWPGTSQVSQIGPQVPGTCMSLFPWRWDYNCATTSGFLKTHSSRVWT